MANYTSNIAVDFTQPGWIPFSLENIVDYTHIGDTLTSITVSVQGISWTIEGLFLSFHLIMPMDRLAPLHPHTP